MTELELIAFEKMRMHIHELDEALSELQKEADKEETDENARWLRTKVKNTFSSVTNRSMKEIHRCYKAIIDVNKTNK